MTPTPRVTITGTARNTAVIMTGTPAIIKQETTRKNLRTHNAMIRDVEMLDGNTI